jgi:GNAT superfamily N-acetyltransferase
MEEQFLIRAAEPRDVPEIMRLIRELSVYEKLEHLVTGTAPMLEESLFGEHARIEAILAERDGRAVGFALYFTSFSTFLCKPGLFLEDVFVEPAQRGRGIGKALLQRLAAICVERGYGRFEWHVLDWNTPSIDFYKSLGATVMPEWQLVRMVESEFKALATK